jgi:APA family basic amino acid/polyamine antiporter
LSPWLPWLSALICLFLMVNLTVETWLRFLVWMALGFGIYFFYGYGHSRVGKGQGVPVPDYTR